MIQDDLRLPDRHLQQLNLAKTELLVFPAFLTLQHNFTTQLGSSTITPSSSVRNLGVILDDKLTFKEHIAKTARSCRFALHNTRKSRPFLIQILVQPLVIPRLDYCSALLAGPLQMIQNAVAWLVFNKLKRVQVTPLFISLHWLPVPAHIKFKTLMLAYRTATGSAPSNFHSLLQKPEIYKWAIPRGTITERHKITFNFTVFVHHSWLVEWSSHPHPKCWFPDKQQLITHLFCQHLTSS